MAKTQSEILIQQLGQLLLQASAMQAEIEKLREENAQLKVAKEPTA